MVPEPEELEPEEPEPVEPEPEDPKPMEPGNRSHRSQSLQTREPRSRGDRAAKADTESKAIGLKPARPAEPPKRSMPQAAKRIFLALVVLVIA